MMNVSTILMAVFIATAYAAWPVVGSYSRASGGWIGTVVVIATGITVAICSAKQLISFPNTKAILLLLIAGAINGVAVYLYSCKVADVTVPTAAFVVTVAVFMSVIAPLLSWLLNGAIPTFYQTLGYGLAMSAIYFLNK